MVFGSVSRLGEFFLDCVYPKSCAGCGSRGRWLCDRCDVPAARFLAPVCSGCGIPIASGVCRCQELPPGIVAVRSVGPYRGWVGGAIRQIKYHGEWARVSHLGPLLAEAVDGVHPLDCIVPVPLHPARLKQRGFNQSEKLADVLAAAIEVPVGRPLARTRRTGAQARLGAGERRENVRGAFAPVPGVDVIGKSVLLIDDVITTGSTLGECAEILRAAGASRVTVLAVAREM